VKKLENILVWMVKQMELAMPMNDGIYTQAEVDDIIGTDCRHCGERIHMKGVYVDSTGGDVCCADKFTEKNENGQHQP